MRKLLFTLFIAVSTSNSFAYYQAQQGRWISRDPVYEIHRISPESLRLNYNLYSFCLNQPSHSIDPLGLIGIRTKSYGGPKSSNCLGYAMTGETGKFAYPDNEINNPGAPYRPDYKTSFKEAIEHEGYSCTEVESMDMCKCECDEDKTLITLFKNTNPENNGKNPWTDSSYHFDGGKITDIHAIRGCGGSSAYTQVPGFKTYPQKPEPDSKIPKHIFNDKRTPLLCCCRPKKEAP